MALRMRKDIKKSSYYVWFLGAQESKGLRGAEYIHPVVKSLVQRERDVEPFKVTLQVSHKGLKLIQNIPPAAIAAGSKPSSKNNKPEVIKHFIPHHAVTCVLQDEDIVSCILLLYNPVTKCPVHVHAYRCDSVETAEILRGQLQTLIERPENQKKIGEIETRLRAKGLLLPPPTQPSRPAPNSSSARRLPSGGGGSDGRSTSTRESESSGGSSSERLSGIGGHQDRIANLYDSLAAELREKLGTGGDGKVRSHAPLLLPPRDYDTVHRQKGNLTAIDLRRCLNANIVGVNAKNTRNLAENGSQVNQKAGTTTNVPGQAGRVNGSSGGSSGIGSDHAPSPDGQDRESDPQYLDNPSSSDEEWNEQPSEDSLFLVQPTAGGRGCSNSSWRGPVADLSLPRARRLHSSGLESPTSPVTHITGTPPDLQAFRRRRAAEERQRSPSPSPSPSPSSKHHESKKGPMSPRDRFKDAKEKFLLLEEQEKQMQRRRNLQASVEQPISPAVLPTAGNSRGNAYPRRGSWSRSRDSEDDLEDRRQRGGYFGGHASAARDGFDTPEPSMTAEDEDDVFEHGFSSSPMPHVTRRESHNNRQVSRENLPHQQDEDFDGRMPLRRGHRPLKTNAQVYRGGRSRGTDEPRFVSHQRYRSPSREDTRPQIQNESPPRGSRTPPDEDIVPDRRQSGHRFRSPTRVARGNEDLSPDRRERFLSPTRNPRPQRNQSKLDVDIGYPSDEVPRYRGGPRDRTSNSSRGHHVLSQQPSFGEDSHSDIPLERYRNPQPVSRHRIKEEEGIDSPETHRRNIEGRLPRANPFQISAAGEKKRRSMFELLEDERRRSSNELAKEFKRRSYQDGGGSELSSSNRGGSRSNNGVSNGRHPGYQELSENERFPGLDRETARVQHHNMPSGGHLNLKKSSGPPPPDVVTTAASRYRHSYAEPHHMLSHPQPSHHHEILHRTNSSVSSGRVGIAAVHPY